jgi:general secretion pathway protein A
LTGEVGTGKTLLLRCLLQLLKQSNDVNYAYLFSSRLAPFEFLQYIVSDFGLPISGKNKAELLLDLCNYVVARGLKNLTTVLVVDEAHHLSPEALEEIRLLTNLETTEHKLLQIVLVGQPELDNTLDSAKLTQLKQRIAIRSHLEPLTFDETSRYIWRRLELVGANSHAQTIFPAATIASVFRHSRGIPRLINTLCENALISAYARKVKSVSLEIVDDVARDLRLNIFHEPQSEEFGVGDEMDLRRAAKVLLDVYASLRKPIAYGTGLTTTPLTERVRQA